MKGRVFFAAQKYIHPETGEILITDEQIIQGLAHKTITRWAWINHNKDVNTEADKAAHPELNIVVGAKKDDHAHIAIETKNNSTELSTIAKWLGIPVNYIEVWKGRGAFLDAVEYLTHENKKQQALGKHRYDDSEVHANFDFRDELNKRAERKLKYGKGDLTLKEQFRYDVLMNGKTLIQCQEESPLRYSEDMTTLKKLRLEYLYKQPAPKTRINYYISGRGGLGKGLCSKALARSLFPTITQDDELFFEVGPDNATFEGYDGQPVIIWNDMRAFELLKLLGGRGNVFRVLDTHPTKQRQNIKYGSINLCNVVNIINSVDSYVTFLDGLAGEYKTKDGEVIKSEDKGQSYRRVPFIINLHEEDFDLLVNKGFLEDSSAFTEFEEYNRIRGNFQKIHTVLRNNEETVKQIESKMLELPKQKFDEVINRESEVVVVTDDILKEFEDYGQMQVEPTQTRNTTDEEILGIHSKDTFTQNEVKELLSEYGKVLKN